MVNEVSDKTAATAKRSAGGRWQRRGLSGNSGHGQKWIRNERRLAIYARDGFRCVYCGCAPTAAKFTLDHVIPREAGGPNGADNLLTACINCNAKRGAASLATFAPDKADTLRARLTAAIDVEAAKAALANCGGFSAAVLAGGR